MEPGDDGVTASASQRVRDFLRQALGLRELICVGAAAFLLVFFAIPYAHVLKAGPVWPTVFGFVLVVVVSRIPISQRAAFIMIGVCLAAYLAMQLIVLSHHHIEPSNDFKTMWEKAKEYAENGLGVPDRPQTQRAIPFYFWVIKIFGSSQSVYLTSNVILHTLSYGMVVWIARRFFGWPAAAKTAFVLLFGIEPLFANTFPSHDVFGVFSIVSFLFLLVEIDARVETDSRPRLGVIGVLALVMSMVIAWADWQRGTGVFCSLALVFYGVAAFVRRPAHWRIRIVLVAGVCAFSTMQGCGLKRAGLAADMPARELTSPEMSMLVFGSDEGDGRFGDWYRNARMANALENEEVARLARFAPFDSLRENPQRKFRKLLERHEVILRTGIDEAWYINDIQSPRWFDQEQLRRLWRRGMAWTRPIWWAMALLVGIAAIFRRDVLFDVRAMPLIVIAMFMAAMGMLGEAQSRYAMFFVFLWPIYAGAPFLRDPLPGLRAKLGPPRQIARGLARVAVSLLVVIAIPIALLAVESVVSKPGLVDFHHAGITVGKTPDREGRAGAPPWWKAVRNHLVIADAAMGSEGVTVTVTATARAPHDDSTLHVVVYNQLGKPLDGWRTSSKPISAMPGVSETVAGRALRVEVDGVPRRTIDLSEQMLPAAFSITGFSEGVHAITLRLDLGDKHRQTMSDKCSHRWTPPDPNGRNPSSNCFNTSIGYVGFY
jgi:hypothetical protein